MRINEILSENQLSELDEGVWDAVKSGAAKVGRGIGAVGQAVGAVAGVPAGIAGAMRKGYNQSAQTIAGGPRVDTNNPTQQGRRGYDQQAVQGNQQNVAPQPAQQGSAVTPMDFDQLSTAIKGAQLTPAQKSQLSQQISGGVPVPQQSSSGAGSSTLGAKQAAGAEAARANMTDVPAQSNAGAGAFGKMSAGLGAPATPNPANVMTNTPVSTTNTAKANNPNAMPSPIATPAAVAAQAAKTTPAIDASGRKIPALQQPKAAVNPAAAAPTNQNAFKYAESIQFQSKFLGRML